MDISVIIVSWNVENKLKDNLRALLTSIGVDYEIFVVDNASTDRTVEMVKQNFPLVKLIINKANLGFSRACNQALKQASGRYLLLLNPDMKVMSDTLVLTVQWLDKNPQAAIAGIRLLNEKQENLPQARRFPKLFDQIIIASKLGHIFPWLLNKYLMKNFDYNKSSQVDSIRGSFFVIRRSALEILGLLDENYFVWFEEVDYCRQAKNKNLQVWYTPAASCFDYVGQSFKQLDIKTTQNYFKNSQLNYFKKWQPAWQLIFLKLAWGVGALVVKLFKK